ncbi:MAG: hypothetical protein ABW067_15455 [Rhizobacter sp.]
MRPDLRRDVGLLLLALAPTLHAQSTTDAVFDPPRDRFVSRAEPEDERAFRRGDLGIVLTSYSRGPLYEAFRALSIGREVADAVETENAQREEAKQADASEGPKTWLDARAEANPKPPKREVVMDRRAAKDALSSFVNCTPGAFALAAQTLQDLVKDFDSADIRAWVDAQDQVFDFCGHVPGTANAPTFPKPLPAARPLRLRQLRDYQIAAARFYAGQYAEAETAFAAIGDTADHPMRDWAALASLRSILRDASLDLTWDRRFDALYRGSLPPAERDAKIAEAARVHNARTDAAVTRLEARAKVLLADPSREASAQLVRNLLLQAYTALQPQRAYGFLSRGLEMYLRNPYERDFFDRWVTLGNRVLDVRRPPDVAALRQALPYYDWIQTVQGCTDNTASPHYRAGRCEQEHAHALAVHAARPTRASLLAAVMTARSLTPENRAALEAAAAVPMADVGAASFRYHAARVYLASGRADAAATLVDGLIVTEKDLDESARELLRAQRFALARDLRTVAPFVRAVTRGPRGLITALAADGDELVNRRLASEDLLALAGQPGVTPSLKLQLVVAAWFRAHLAGKPAVAEAAARQVTMVSVPLRAAADDYVRRPQDRNAIILATLARFEVSPVVLRLPIDRFGLPRKATSAGDAWCAALGAETDAEVRRIQRTLPQPRLGVDAGRADAEMSRLAAVGGGPQWFAREVFATVDQRGDDPEFRTLLLRALVESTERGRCPDPVSDTTRHEANRRLGKA